MLKRLIAHQIIKEKGETDAAKQDSKTDSVSENGKAETVSLHLRDKVLPAESPLAGELLNHLRQSFENRNPVAGVFKTETAGNGKTIIPAKSDSAAKETSDFLFRPALLQFWKQPSDRAFVDFTVSATESLRDGIAKQPLATGGYVVFVQYDLDEEDYLMTALLTTQARPSFDQDLNLVATNPLDFEHLKHGARVLLSAAEANTEGVVQFFSPRAEGVSEYFIEFLGCQEMVRPDVQVRRIERALGDYAAKLPVKKRAAVRHRAHAYMKESADTGRDITRVGIANAVDPDDPKPVRKHLAIEKYRIAGKFRGPSDTVLKRFVHFAFNGQGLRLEFDHNPWMNRMRWNRAERIVTITSAPAELIAALERRK